MQAPGEERTEQGTRDRRLGGARMRRALGALGAREDVGERGGSLGNARERGGSLGNAGARYARPHPLLRIERVEDETLQ